LRLGAEFTDDEFGLSNLAQNAHCSAIQDIACIRQADLASGTVQKAHAEPAFQPLYPAQNGGAGYSEGSSRRRKATVVDHRRKNPEIVLNYQGVPGSLLRDKQQYVA
jgi:hypothetical protein